VSSRSIQIAGFGAVLLLAACNGGGEPADTQPDGNAEESLEQAVAALMLATQSDQVRASYGSVPSPVVEPQRESADGSWAFGGSYFPVPADKEDTGPVTALYVAHRVDDTWDVALEDSARFAELAERAPDDVMSESERGLFALRAHLLAERERWKPTSAQAVGEDVGLGLPFQRNGAVWGHWGPHGWSGQSYPYNSIDFFGGDGRVLASRGGYAYKFCTDANWPLIKIVHDNGWTTSYYHTRAQASISNGQYMAEGAFIGMTGVELPCGGSASGNHVHWSLYRGGTSGSAETVHDKLIGGWTWYADDQPYGGSAARNGTVVYSGNTGLVNYGYGEPCSGTGCTKYTGSLSGTGQSAFYPGTGGFSWSGGTLQGWLQGPGGVDFDLVLGKYNSSTGAWDKAASSDGPTANEAVTFNAAAGTYRWRINAYSGSGAFTFWAKQ
jgi:LasA protease